MMFNTSSTVDEYFDIGCGRCKLVGTPSCKVNKWRELLLSIRRLVLKSGLTEERKWGVPCYTWEGKNVVIIGALKEYCSISFFKGALLADDSGLLQKPGDNSNAGRVIRLTHLSQLSANESQILSLIRQSIEIERKGLVVPKNSQPIPTPQELQDRFDESPVFESAFRSLTPGRQKEYLLYFSQAKQSATRIARIERYYQKILAGKSLSS